METVIEIAINQISLTNGNIIAATLNFNCIKNAKTEKKEQCGEVRSLPWSKVKGSFREVSKDYYIVLTIFLSLAKSPQIILLISATRNRLENNY